MGNKAIFLDRDGVINQERGTYTYRKEDFLWVPGIIDKLKEWREMGYLLVVITNQSGIAKGIYSHEQLHTLHQFMSEQIALHKVTISAIYYCPHHPSVSKCLCRKPQTLMIEKALARFNIDAPRSYLIGDSDRDIQAGDKTGLQTIKIAPNADLREQRLP